MERTNFGDAPPVSSEELAFLKLLPALSRPVMPRICDETVPCAVATKKTSSGSSCFANFSAMGVIVSMIVFCMSGVQLSNMRHMAGVSLIPSGSSRSPMGEGVQGNSAAFAFGTRLRPVLLMTLPSGETIKKVGMPLTSKRPSKLSFASYGRETQSPPFSHCSA